MSLTDYVIDLLLVGLVLRQTRTRRLTPRDVVLPLVLVGAAAANYLRAWTPGGNDLLLVGLLTLTGITLGTLSGLTTRVWRDDEGVVWARANLLAAAYWVLGMGSRFAFAWYSTHTGRSAVGRFSRDHQITGAQAWTTALVLMAVGEVLARVGVLQARRVRLTPARVPSPHAL